MSACTSVRPRYSGRLDPHETPCHREVDADGRHVGDHQGWEPMTTPEGEPWSRLWTWSKGGSSGSARHDRHPDTCRVCGCLHWPETMRREPDADLAVCWACALWEGRAARHGREAPARALLRDSISLRPHGDALAHHPRLYGWSEGVGGAFGGRQFVVTHDDGHTYGPGDFLWDSGAIPWWLLDRFPPNCRIEPAGQIARPGWTDASGRPLAYTAHPEVR